MIAWRGRLAPEARTSIRRAVLAGLGGMRAEPPMWLSDWAAQHFRLAGESSQQQGDWHAWSFQRAILDWMGDDRIQEVYVKKSKRVGYSKMLLAALCYAVAYKRRNTGIWQPTDDDRDSWVKTELEPVLDQVDAVRVKRKRGGTLDTIKLWQFMGAMLHTLGGKAARAYRRLTLALAAIDEWDGFDQQIEKSADPGTLAKGRLEGAAYPKFIGGSTPRVKGLSHVGRACDTAKVYMRPHIVCPHCGVDHPLAWGGKDALHGFKWEPGRPETVRHVCPHCRESITQAQYLSANGMPMDVEWVCQRTGARYSHHTRAWLHADGEPMARPPVSVGVHVWAAYSPQRTWASIVEEFLKAHQILRTGDDGPMQGWVNETQGEEYELQGEKTDEHALLTRAEDLPLEVVPQGGLVLTMGGDLQGNRGELAVWAWGQGLESWPVAHHIIEGNPQADEFWERVEQFLFRRYVQAWHGGTMGVDAISFDANYQTQAVLNFVRRMRLKGLNIVAVRGEGDAKKPILCPGTSQDINWQGKRWPAGTKLYGVGNKAVKDLLHGQLQIAQPGPGFVHLNKRLPREWFEQLTAEQRVLVKTAHGLEERWVKRRARNEVLDCRNYATHAAYMLGLHRWTDKRWQEQAQAVQPPRDLFSVVAHVVQAIVLPQVLEPDQDEVGTVPDTPETAVPVPVAHETYSQRPVPRGW